MRNEQIGKISRKLLENPNLRAGLLAGVLITESMATPPPPTFAQTLTENQTIVSQPTNPILELETRLGMSLMLYGVAISAAVGTSYGRPRASRMERLGMLAATTSYLGGATLLTPAIWNIPLPF